MTPIFAKANTASEKLAHKQLVKHHFYSRMVLWWSGPQSDQMSLTSLNIFYQTFTNWKILKISRNTLSPKLLKLAKLFLMKY